jgi:hypothetical protein
MHYKELKTEKYTLTIDVDENPSDPREDDNLTKMICFHKKYTLGDKHDYKFDNYNIYTTIRVLQYLVNRLVVLGILVK